MNRDHPVSVIDIVQLSSFIYHRVFIRLMGWETLIIPTSQFLSEETFRRHSDFLKILAHCILRRYGWVVILCIRNGVSNTEQKKKRKGLRIHNTTFLVIVIGVLYFIISVVHLLYMGYYVIIVKTLSFIVVLVFVFYKNGGKWFSLFK